MVSVPFHIFLYVGKITKKSNTNLAAVTRLTIVLWVQEDEIED